MTPQLPENLEPLLNAPADVLEAVGSQESLLPLKEPLGVRMAGYFGRHQLLLLFLSTFFLWLIVALPPLRKGDLKVGNPAPRDIVAPQNAFLFDRAETGKFREAAAALVPPAYDPNPGAQSVALQKLKFLAAQTRRAIPLPAPAPLFPPKKNTDWPARFQQFTGWRPAPGVAALMIGVAPARWASIEAAAGTAVRAVYRTEQIRSDVPADVLAIRPLLAQNIAKIQNRGVLSAAEAEVARALAVRVAVVPNVVVNARATETARKDARNAVLPVFRQVEANTVLVQEGKEISEEQGEQLQSLGLVAPRFEPWQALAKLVLCLTLVLVVAAHLARSRHDILGRPAALWLISFIPILALAGFRGLLSVPHADFSLVPLAAAAAMLLTVLVGPRAGLPAGFVVAALGALMARGDAGLFLAATLSGWIGTFLVSHIATRFSLVRTGFLLALANAAIGASLGILRGTGGEELLSSVAWSAVAALFSVMGMAALANILERPFGITSHLRLLELLAPDEIVLRRMQTEAPGTYTHSLMVATLSEAAAKVVGADALLCRVGGLYHDIGKLRRPHCFIENQHGDNIHERLSPGLSALLIKAHVKDGLELGRAIRLPAPVLEIIEQHHGTSLIGFFFHRARQSAEKEGNGAPDERNFRYPGPKPRLKEAAIVMLADSVEASARALPLVTPEILENHIKTLFAARLEEGQLDDAALSLREIGLVREAFWKTLRGVMHHRIEYPDPSRDLEEAGEWVRETLGEPEEKPREKFREKPRETTKVANPAQTRQNKERSVEKPSANENLAPRPARSRRFRPGLPPGLPPVHVARTNGHTSKSPPAPQNGAANLDSPEPSRATRAGDAASGAPDANSGSTLQNGTNGAQNGHFTDDSDRDATFPPAPNLDNSDDRT